MRTALYRLLEPVQRAPSVHNTQPWYFRIAADDRIDICARFGGSAGVEFTMNGNGRLLVSPALRRELIISCGAALYNLRLAIRLVPATTSRCGCSPAIPARWSSRRSRS